MNRYVTVSVLLLFWFCLQLDQEISRLERLLELPVEPYPRLTEELMFLLPESRVDPSPTNKRRRLQERDM